MRYPIYVDGSPRIAVYTNPCFDLVLRGQLIDKKTHCSFIYKTKLQVNILNIQSFAVHLLKSWKLLPLSSNSASSFAEFLFNIPDRPISADADRAATPACSSHTWHKHFAHSLSWREFMYSSWVSTNWSSPNWDNSSVQTMGNSSLALTNSISSVLGSIGFWHRPL